MVDTSPLARIDSFAYRHRLGEVMARPVLTCTAGLTVAQAADLMDSAAKSSIVVVDGEGRAIGMFTERDLLRLMARHRGEAHRLALRDVMSAPVKTVGEQDFLFVALGRMSRLGLRHLVVVDDLGRPSGMITARILIELRITEALVLGDDIAVAASGADMARARARLPRLARKLLDEGVAAREVAAVISQVLRDMTARAAELAVESLRDDGWGEAPAPWGLMILGSGGRGESLLAFDQDNAVVHAGGEGDDPWFAELGRRVNDILATAGIPYCNGLVMARERQWRRPLAEWKHEVWRWVHEPAGQELLNCDIFFDLQPVYGDRSLVEQLRSYALEAAANAPFFVQFLTLDVGKMRMPLGILGGWVLRRRLNAKKCGLLPLVSAARAKAVKLRIAATGTAERLAGVAAAGRMHPEDLRSLVDAHEVILRAMLEQQLADIANGGAPGNDIEPRRFDRAFQARLSESFRRIRMLKTMLESLGASD